MAVDHIVRASNTRRLTEINRAMTYARSLDEVLTLTVECATELLEAPRAVLMLNGEDGLLRIRAARGVPAEAVDRFEEPLDENLLMRLTGLLGANAREHFLGVPLVVQGNVIGLLATRLADDQEVNEEAEWLLSALADQAAVALESTRNDDVRVLLESRIGELERHQKGKDRALEILSHDLRTPLGAVLGYTALLSSEVLGSLNERQQNALQRIKVVCDHMESILANVLEMARLTGGQMQVVLDEIDPAEVIAGAADIVRPAADRAQIALQVTNRPVDPIRSDAPRLRLVLVQLIDNAIKYAPEKTEVRIEYDVTERDGRRWVEFTVSDEGPGIEAERQAEIFEPYVRKDGATERAKSGVGLGLSIAKGIVQRLGGTISVESAAGMGTTFHVLLPANGAAK